MKRKKINNSFVNTRCRLQEQETIRIFYLYAIVNGGSEAHIRDGYDKIQMQITVWQFFLNILTLILFYV